MFAAKTKDHIGCTCTHCGGGFRISPQRHAQGGGVYCSKSCKDEARPGPQRECAACGTSPRNCERCGKYFIADRSELAKGWGRSCSNHCRRTRREHILQNVRRRLRGRTGKSPEGCRFLLLFDCRGRGMRNRVKLECQNCGNEFERPASASAAHFCSRTCNSEARRNDPEEIERVRQMQRDELASRESTQTGRYAPGRPVRPWTTSPGR